MSKKKSNGPRGSMKGNRNINQTSVPIKVQEEEPSANASVVVKVPMADNRYTIQKIAESNNRMAEAISNLAVTNNKLAELLMLAPQITVKDSTFINNDLGLKIETDPEKYNIKEYAINTNELEEEENEEN